MTTVFIRIARLFAFIVFYLREMLMANLQLAWDAITPTHLMRPAVLKLPLDATTEIQIFLLGNLMTMTPGTLCIDVSPDRKTMFVHAMYAGDPEKAVAHLKEFERRLLRLFH